MHAAKIKNLQAINYNKRPEGFFAGNVFKL
jgi:hypothetical protein